MKHFLFIALLSMLSCQKTENCSDMSSCSGECLFILNEQSATTYFLSCYDRWGVVYEDQSQRIGLIIDDINDSLKKDNLSVKICGYARENKIPMQFPDPFLESVYQFDAVMLELD